MKSFLLASVGCLSLATVCGTAQAVRSFGSSGEQSLQQTFDSLFGAAAQNAVAGEFRTC